MLCISQLAHGSIDLHLRLSGWAWTEAWNIEMDLPSNDISWSIARDLVEIKSGS